MKRNSKKADAAAKVLAYLQARDAGKAAYAESDRLLAELTEELVLDEEIVLSDGRKARLVDAFAGKLKVWKLCGVSRFELKVSEGK